MGFSNSCASEFSRNVGMFYSCFAPSTKLEQTKINNISQDFLRFNNFPTPIFKKQSEQFVDCLGQKVGVFSNWSGLPNWAMRWKFRPLGLLEFDPSEWLRCGGF